MADATSPGPGHPQLYLATEPAADAFLARDPLALLLGTLLDQQVPMERAFVAPYRLAQRLGRDRLDARELASYEPTALSELFATPPSLHRFPGAMAGRAQRLCQELTHRYGGDAGALWRDVGSGAALVERLSSLPGFGAQKARILTALLGKQFGVRPPGWREAAGEYGEDGVYRSAADVTDADSLTRVRDEKKRRRTGR